MNERKCDDVYDETQGTITTTRRMSAYKYTVLKELSWMWTMVASTFQIVSFQRKSDQWKTNRKFFSLWKYDWPDLRVSLIRSPLINFNKHLFHNNNNNRWMGSSLECSGRPIQSTSQFFSKTFPQTSPSMNQVIGRSISFWLSWSEKSGQWNLRSFHW